LSDYAAKLGNPSGYFVTIYAVVIVLSIYSYICYDICSQYSL